MTGASPHTTVPSLNPRSCTGACSVKTASPWTTSGRSSGIGSPQIQVTGGLGDSPCPPGARCFQWRGTPWAQTCSALPWICFVPWARTARLSLSFPNCNVGQCASLVGARWRESISVQSPEHTVIYL